MSDFRPKIGLELYEALSDGNWERARKLRDICLPYQNFRCEIGQDNQILGTISGSAVKKGLELAGLNAGGGAVHEPIRPLSTEEERRAEDLYRQLEDNIDALIDR